VIDEPRKNIHLRLTFEFLGKDKLKVTEVYVIPGENKTFVDYTFSRKPETVR
jgi:hypothetical protein